MSLNMMKRSLSRMLRQSIIDLCKNSVGAEGYVEIDGIVCITVGEEESEEIVVKVHEILGEDEEPYIPPRSFAPTSHAPPRSIQAAPGRPGQGQRMPPNQPPHSSAQMSKPNYGQGRKPGQPMYTQAGGPRGMGGPHGPDHHQRQPTPTKNSQDIKKQQQQQQQPGGHMGGQVIKIEIDSDDEHSDGVSPGAAPVTRAKMSAPSRNQPPHSCQICDHNLPSTKALKQHVREAHGAVVCEVCWQPFATKIDLDKHMKTHEKSQSPHPGASPRPESGKAEKKDGNERFKCGVCGNTSDARQTMVDHLRSGHEFQGCYTCMLCREYFPNKPTFTIHRRLSHPKAEEVMCQNCGVGLEQKEYENHRKECMEEENNSKQTPQKGGKKTPVTDNTKGGTPAKRQRMDPPRSPSTRSKKTPSKASGDKSQHECPICCQILDTFPAYERHIASVHSRIVCAICAGTLKNNRAATQHMKRHTDNFPFTCVTCGIGNQSHLELRRHMVVAHKHQPAYFTCPQCNLYLNSRQEFMSHMRETHKVDFLDDDELENYVVFEEEGDDDMYNDDEDGDYMDEDEGFNQNHGRMNMGPGIAYHGEVPGDYDMDDDEDYEEGLDETGELVTCNICELNMPSLATLKEHISAVHHAVVCEICWRPFLNQTEFEAHMKSHHSDGHLSSKEASGKMTPVSKQSTPTSSLANATTTTAPSKNSNSNAAASSGKTTASSFKCGVCGSASEGQKTMVEHLKAAHEFLGCYTCLLCGEFFPNKPTYTIHRKLSHSDAAEVTCENCTVGLMKHEVDGHMAECTGTGIDIKDAEWEGGKKGIKKEK